jgi:hypothetical protein
VAQAQLHVWLEPAALVARVDDEAPGDGGGGPGAVLLVQEDGVVGDEGAAVLRDLCAVAAVVLQLELVRRREVPPDAQAVGDPVVELQLVAVDGVAKEGAHFPGVLAFLGAGGKGRDGGGDEDGRRP